MKFHRVQLRVVQAHHKRGRQVLVGLEMYPATTAEQQWLDRWHADKTLGEEAFLAESHWYKSWGYHWNYYRDIFLFARENGIRMFGVNVPRDVVQTARTKGLEALTPEQRALLPARVDTENAEHQRLFRAFFGEADSLHGNMPDAMFQGMYRAQCTWNAAMGWNALQALKKHGGEKAIMVVLVGSVDPEFTGGPKFEADWRKWGDCYWWQNTRLPPCAAIASGDYDQCRALFRMYREVLPICRARAKSYYGADGVYFPETMTIFGTYANNDYGWKRQGHQPNEVLCPWWCYVWQQGLELVMLMQDYYDHTQDRRFLRDDLLPMAADVLRYYDTRFARDQAAGRLTRQLDPFRHFVLDKAATERP